MPNARTRTRPNIGFARVCARGVARVLGLRDVIPAVLGLQAVEATPHADVTVDLAAARSGGDRVHVYKLPGRHNPDVRFTPLRAGQRFRLPPDASGRGALTIEAVPTPGHTADHACFWVAEERAAFTGDLVLGSNTSVVFEDLHAHMASLERLAAFEPALLLPGHGEPIADDAAARVRRDLRHRQQREQEVLGAVAATPASASSGGATARNVVDAVYRGYPEPLKRLALGSVVLHLLKLERDGRVGRVAAAEPRRAGRPAPTEDPATYKGPGGLTMLQVHGLLQDSLAKDRTGAARSAAAGDNVHPCHVGLDRLYDVRWRATPPSSQRRS